MINILNTTLSPNTPVTAFVPQWGGTVEFINYSPYVLSIDGGNGVPPLAPNSKMAIAGMANGSGYSIMPSQQNVPPSTSSLQLVVNWGDSQELATYSAQEINTPVMPPQQAGAGANVSPATELASSGGSFVIGPFEGKTVYLYGFDVTGDKATANTGIIEISGIVDPITLLPISPLFYYVDQGPNSTTPLSIRFPVTLQSAVGRTETSPEQGFITFAWPNMSASVYCVIWFAYY